MKSQYGVDSMPETGENVAEEFQITRADQDAFALRSQQRAAKAIASGYFAQEIVAVEIAGRQGRTGQSRHRTSIRAETTLEQLAKLKPFVRNPGTVTAGNASGVNDGAAAMIVASEAAVKAHGLTPRARILGMASAGVPPRIMGIGPVPSTRKLMARLGHKIADFDVIELNEAFASQSLACLRQLGLADDAEHVNPHGGAIALGHPLGMSGARLALTAAHRWKRHGGKRGARHHVRRRRAGRFAGAGTRLVRIPAARGLHADQGDALVPMSAGYIPFHPNPSKPNYKPPAGAVDAHCHVFGPEATFPFAPERKYTPCDAPKEKLFALRDFLGFDKNVIVQATLPWQGQPCDGRRAESSNNRAKGVAFVGEEVTDAELKAHGPRRRARACASISSSGWSILPRATCLSASPARVEQLGWHIVIYFEMPDLPELEASSPRCRPTLVVDHMGTPDVQQGRRPSGEPALPPADGRASEFLGAR